MRDPLTWTRTAVGIYLPAGVRPEGPSEYEATALRAAQQQARSAVYGSIAAFLAFTVSVVALLLSIDTWRSQQEQQRRVNSLRVSMWAVLGQDSSSVRPAGLDVTIQNRAPAPLHELSIEAKLDDGHPAVARLGDIPPCTEQTLRIAPPPDTAFARGREQWYGYTELKLVFFESGRGWRLAKDSLQPVGAPPSYPAAQPISQATPRLHALDGCG